LRDEHEAARLVIGDAAGDSAPIALGVDFGTTNSVVALAYADNRVETLCWPSLWGMTDTFRTALVFWSEAPRKLAYAAGPEAIARAIEPSSEQRFIQSIKTHLASKLFTETRIYGEKFTLERLIGFFLARLLAGTRLGEQGPGVVVAGRPVVFAGSSPDEGLALARLEAAYASAGVKGVALAYEPLGAAYWYARKLDRTETVLIADFGGGTSDFSVMRFARHEKRTTAQSLAHGGVGIAGDTFDFRIIDHVVAPRLGKGTFFRSFDKRLPIPAFIHASFAHWHQLSWLKSAQTFAELRALAARAEAPEQLEHLITIVEQDLGFELYQVVGGLKAKLSAGDTAQFHFCRCGIEIETEVTRSEFESWIAADVARIGEAMDATIGTAGLRNDEIDAVFLTGGTSFVPSVRALFLERFDAARIHTGDAFQSVASGLALMAAERALGSIAT
jgi:hypothetical chaperone protein